MYLILQDNENIGYTETTQEARKFIFDECMKIRNRSDTVEIYKHDNEVKVSEVRNYILFSLSRHITTFKIVKVNNLGSDSSIQDFHNPKAVFLVYYNDNLRGYLPTEKIAISKLDKWIVDIKTRYLEKYTKMYMRYTEDDFGYKISVIGVPKDTDEPFDKVIGVVSYRRCIPDREFDEQLVENLAEDSESSVETNDLSESSSESTEENSSECDCETCTEH